MPRPPHLPAPAHPSNTADGGAPLFRATGLRHPAGVSGRDGTFVPNNISLGGSEVPPFVVLTGGLWVLLQPAWQVLCGSCGRSDECEHVQVHVHWHGGQGPSVGVKTSGPLPPSVAVGARSRRPTTPSAIPTCRPQHGRQVHAHAPGLPCSADGTGAAPGQRIGLMPPAACTAAC